MGVITSPKLLKRVRDIADDDAWDQFYQIYSRLIVNFCRQRNLPTDMIHDVLQETMVCLLKQMPNFAYDPTRGKFRSFLLKIVDCRIKDSFKRHKRYCAVTSTRDHDWIVNMKDSKIKTPCREWDDMWDNNLMLKAIERVKQKVEAVTYNSFRIYVLQKRPIEDVKRTLADRYGVIASRNAIYQHKNRMLGLIKKEVELLKFEMGD